MALIPARGGSKSIPDKNLRPLGGKPLLAWSVETARGVSGIDRVVVSTDSERIGEAAIRLGAEVAQRPPRLATDESLVIDTIRYHLDEWKDHGDRPDILVLLEPTCPFRGVEDVEECLRLLVHSAYDSAATFTAAETNPHRAWRIEHGSPVPFIEGAVPWKPRQQLPDAYRLNGAVYAFHAPRLPSAGVELLFGRAAAVRMPAERSHDIDTPLDFALAELLIQQQGGGGAE